MTIKKKYFSVITVTYNAENNLKGTLDSVLMQKYDYIEMIIVDGDSTDSTIEIIKEYEEHFLRRGYDYLWITERDNGIYDAMNKGIDMLQGEWCIFINSGDKLAHNKVLSDIYDLISDEEAACVYGNTVNYRDGIYYNKKAKMIDKIEYDIPFTHQALFTRHNIIKKYRFDISYKYAADYEQWLRMYKKGISFRRIDYVVSIFDMNGISQDSRKDYNTEWLEILDKYECIKKANVRNLLKIFYRVKLVPLIKKNNLMLKLYLLGNKNVEYQLKK